MKILLELSDILTTLCILSIVIYSVLLIGTIDSISRIKKIKMAIYLFVIFYLASAYSHHLFSILIKNLK